MRDGLGAQKHPGAVSHYPIPPFPRFKEPGPLEWELLASLSCNPIDRLPR